jgi:hypothetical protein
MDNFHPSLADVASSLLMKTHPPELQTFFDISMIYA